MALIRWDPIRDLDSLQSDMNRLFDRFFEAKPAGGSGIQRWIPAMDLLETQTDLVLRADLPGMTEGDVEIEIKDDVLTISGERRDDRDGKEERFHRVERSFGRFSRALSLPHGVDPDNVAASFQEGVLEVHIPKPEPTPPTRVEIEKGAVEGTATEK